jgi:hypothetical protein
MVVLGCRLLALGGCIEAGGPLALEGAVERAHVEAMGRAWSSEGDGVVLDHLSPTRSSLYYDRQL